MSMNGNDEWTSCELKNLLATVLAVPDDPAVPVFLDGPEASEVGW
jgi:DMSO/TMAO reductase YedYZ molybdopterin-dependent catalytic subunit